MLALLIGYLYVIFKGSATSVTAYRIGVSEGLAEAYDFIGDTWSFISNFIGNGKL